MNQREQRDRNAIMRYARALMAVPIPQIESGQLRAAFHDQRVNLLAEIYGLEEMVVDEPKRKVRDRA